MPKYRADGTIRVQLDSTGKTKAIMFIPDKSFQQGDGKFVVFVPWAKAEERTGKVSHGLVVREKHICLDLPCGKLGELLLQAAVRDLKVTVLVSSARGGNPKLEEVVIPAIPT